MKLLTIRLHPFGGTADRTCTLHDGINVLEGPNEFGKSTLREALWHALFTSTKLTPANLRNTMGRWYPRPGGDHVRVSLQFHADGKLWSLQKSWGAGAASSLQADGAASIADPASVQAELNSLLKRNEATWRHVLFTGQAQLAATMQQLSRNSEHLDDVQSLLAGPAAIPGDIPPDKLTAALATRIQDHFGRWDIPSNGPEKGRGISQPWTNGKGPLLEAYYAQETVNRELTKVIDHEKTVDEINAQILTLMSEISADEDFIRTGRSMRDGLSKREGLEERCKRLNAEVGHLKTIMQAWPGATQVIDGKAAELSNVKQDLEALDAELNNARKRKQAEQVRLAHELLTQAKNDWQRAADDLAASQALPPASLAELARLEKEIDSRRIEIAAQKLTAKLETCTARSIQVQRGSGEPETIALSPSATWESQAEGIFRLEHEGLKISVESGTGDVNALFAALETARQGQADILAILGHESLSAAKLAETEHQKLSSAESSKKGLYRAALQGRSEEEWAAEMAALAELPDTRSIEVLEYETNTRRKRVAALEFEIGQEQEKIERWTEEHQDLESLTDKIIAQTTDLNQAKQELAGLPVLPDGFDSIADYLNQLGRKEAASEQRVTNLNQQKVEQGRLTGIAPETTAEELRADLEIKRREFQRRNSEGQALLRIQSKLQKLIDERGIEDPMQGLAAAVSDHFRKLTDGRYHEVTLEGTAPTRVGGAVDLETEWLSQGTLGSLALATRLALSELYLKDMSGFFLLDDPLTDMDAARRAAAIHAIGDFAEKHQVLFFTCHPAHANELQQLAGAKSLQMSP
jgi:exonuclease SbcC